MNAAAIIGEFTHFKHIKTRKVVVLEVEVPEELFQDVISKLGMPIGGESKPVAVSLLDKQVYNTPPVVGKSDIQQTEGEKLRTRAVMLCGDFASTLCTIAELELAQIQRRLLGIIFVTHAKSNLALSWQPMWRRKKNLNNY